MSSNDATPDQPDRVPIYQRPAEVEGTYPPAASLVELRQLLNVAWRLWEELRDGQIARIKRAAYERGLRANADQYAAMAEGDKNQLGKVIDRAAEAEAKLEQIAELAATPPSGEDELAIRIRAVLEQ